MRLKQDQRGQSTIEFIFAFTFSLCVVFLVFNSAINYVTGYLVHYATFMASRAYLTFDTHVNTNAGLTSGAEALARQVFANYKLNIFKVSDSNFQVNNVRAMSAGDYVTVGAYTSYETKLDIIGQVAGEAKAQMVSESFLGKEPSRFTCSERVCKAITGSSTCDDGMDVTLFDDGC